jgi:UDP-N-acetylmuramoylalanine--D-glutamate ligase
MQKTSTVNSSNDLMQARKNSIQEFSGIEHRLEVVAERNGVEYINDSKATDFTTSWYSLSCMNKPVIWILGISEMQDDYSVFADIVKEKVKAIIVFGRSENNQVYFLRKLITNFSEVLTVEEAVETASSLAHVGEAVLFSPACSSFEMFENYKQRGEYFRKCVLK